MDVPRRRENDKCMAFSEGYISVNTKQKITNLGSFNSPCPQLYFCADSNRFYSILSAEITLQIHFLHRAAMSYYYCKDLDEFHSSNFYRTTVIWQDRRKKGEIRTYRSSLDSLSLNHWKTWYSRTWLYGTPVYVGQFSLVRRNIFCFAQALAMWDSWDGPLSVPLIQVRLYYVLHLSSATQSVVPRLRP